MTAITNHEGAGLSYIARQASGAAPIVMLHGIGSHAQSFVPLIDALEDRPAIAWNAPGYGTSQPLAAEWPDASDYAQALRRLLAHLDVPSCILLGHSLGALIAARFALRWPQQVDALLLISPALGYAAEKGGPLPAAVARRIEDLDRLGAETFAATRAPRLLADPDRHPELVEQVARAMAAVRRPGYEQACRMLATGRLLEDAASLQVPTAVLVGSRDRITPPKDVRRAFDALRTSVRLAFHELPDAGHAVYQEQPQSVARAITALVDGKAGAHA